MDYTFTMTLFTKAKVTASWNMFVHQRYGTWWVLGQNVLMANSLKKDPLHFNKKYKSKSAGKVCPPGLTETISSQNMQP